MPLSTPYARNAICFASDRNYLDFTLVAISSIVTHASPDCQYDIVILGTDCQGREAMFEPLQSENVHIRILDMEEYIEKFDMRSFYVSGTIPMATYFRFFIPEIFADYDKVLYLDGDILVCDDVQKLLNEDIEGCLVGGMRDIAMFWVAGSRLEYVEKTLGVSSKEYFCAGVLLYNIKECRAFDLPAKSLAKLKELVDPPFHDQDVLNAVTSGRTRQLPQRWHFITEAFRPHIRAKVRLEPEAATAYDQAEQNLGLLHFAGAKPWNEESIAKADLWWAAADATSAGPALRLRLEKLRSDRRAEAIQLMGRPWLFLTYALYKIRTLLSSGNARNELKRKAKLLKYLIRNGI